jgi:cell division inhibitor SepF
MNDEDELEPPRPSMLHRIGNFFSLRDDEDEYLEEPEAAEPHKKVVAFSRDGRKAIAPAEVSIFTPRSFADVTGIADALRTKHVVIVNLQGADRGLLQRVVDFTSGVAYTIDGRIQKLSDAMYLVVPPSITVNPQGLRDSLVNENTIDFRDHRG